MIGLTSILQVNQIQQEFEGIENLITESFDDDQYMNTNESKLNSRKHHKMVKENNRSPFKSR
jgi:hypothetical protein